MPETGGWQRWGSQGGAGPGPILGTRHLAALCRLLVTRRGLALVLLFLLSCAIAMAVWTWMLLQPSDVGTYNVTVGALKVRAARLPMSLGATTLLDSIHDVGRSGPVLPSASAHLNFNSTLCSTAPPAHFSVCTATSCVHSMGAAGACWPPCFSVLYRAATPPPRCMPRRPSPRWSPPRLSSRPLWVGQWRPSRTQRPAWRSWPTTLWAPKSRYRATSWAPACRTPTRGRERRCGRSTQAPGACVDEQGQRPMCTCAPGARRPTYSCGAIRVRALCSEQPIDEAASSAHGTLCSTSFLVMRPFVPSPC